MRKKGKRKSSTFKFKESELTKLIHPSKVEIMKLINHNKEMNFLQLKNHLKKPMDYREVRRHSETLLKAGVLKKDRKKRKRGRPVFLRIRKRIIVKS